MHNDTVNIGFHGPESAAPIHEAVALLRERDDFLILCHQKPDGDTVGSAFALREALRQMGKRAQVACSDPITPRYDFITGGEREPHRDFIPKTYITVDIADPRCWAKNLTICAPTSILPSTTTPAFRALQPAMWATLQRLRRVKSSTTF